MNGIVQIGCLGSLGRFGNQLFQYAFARGYAESIGAQLETPAWIGQRIFDGIQDPTISKSLPTLGTDEHPNDRTNINLNGYFQFSECFKSYTITKLRQWFKIKAGLVDKYGQPRGKVVAHLRRGDYTTAYSNVFCVIPFESYSAALRQYGYSDAVVVTDDKPEPVVEDSGMEFLPDFLTLCNCDVLFRANSTFSWWAGTIGEQLKVFSPVVDGLRGLREAQFVEGNKPRCVDLPNVNDYNIEP